MEAKDIQGTDEYKMAVYWAELASPTKGKRAINDLIEVSLKAGMKEVIRRIEKAYNLNSPNDADLIQTRFLEANLKLWQREWGL